MDAPTVAAQPAAAPAPAARPGNDAPTTAVADDIAEVEPVEADADAEPADEEAAVGRRAAWGRWLHQSSAMIISGAVHMVALIVLSLLVIEPPGSLQMPEVIAQVVEEPELQDDLKVELENQLTHVQEVTSQMVSSSMELGAVGASGPQGLISAPTVDKGLLEQVVNSEVNIEGVFVDVPSTKRLIVEAPDGQIGDARAVVGSYQEALDRLTQEILWMLDKGPVLVVWLFDQSESMKDDQKEIRDRIEHVYTELGLMSKTNSGALETSVCSYGNDPNFRVHTRAPTSARTEIMAAIDDVPLDLSGEEYMCSAVLKALQIHRPYAQRARRQLAVIIVTDESGNRNDNDANMERAIQELKNARSRLYVLGREAVFGYPYARIRWQHPQSKRIHWLPIDRGPETAFVEQLQIDGYHRRWDAHPAGFGPYEATRMARETGGIFFLLPSLETNLVRGEKITYEMQAAYYPDLRSRPEVKADIDRSPLRTTLEKVIYDLNPYKEKMAELRVDGFSTDYEPLARQIQQELTKVPTLLQYLSKAELAVSKLADERKQESSPRWQANYDLLHAQTIAYQARVHEYGAYMEQFLKDLQAYVRNPTDPKNKFKPPPKTKGSLIHDDWHVRGRTQTITGDKIKPYVERSTAMFKQVIQDHPGTPWAARADAEIRRGFGVELYPEYEPPLPNTKLTPPPKY